MKFVGRVIKYRLGRLSSQQQQQLAALAQQHHSRNSASVVRESPAQKAAAAKLKLRRELEQHLLRVCIIALQRFLSSATLILMGNIIDSATKATAS